MDEAKPTQELLELVRLASERTQQIHEVERFVGLFNDGGIQRIVIEGDMLCIHADRPYTMDCETLVNDVVCRLRLALEDRTMDLRRELSRIAEQIAGGATPDVGEERS